MAKTSLLTFNLDSNVQKLKAMKNVASVNIYLVIWKAFVFEPNAVILPVAFA